jgi:hypothetical protein
MIAMFLATRLLGVQILDDTCMQSAKQTRKQKPVYVSRS